jgi:Ca2+-binding EF-hand superfamily protein
LKIPGVSAAAFIGLFILVSCSSSKETSNSTPATRDQYSFENLDVNADNQISLDEFKAKIPARRRSPEEIFRMVDQDNSGMISQSEYQTFRERVQRMRQQRGRRW